MTNHCITFATDGTARTLWTDDLPLHDLGTLTVERASTIEFNLTKQEWEVRLVRKKKPSPVMFSHPSRAECIAWEHRFFNDQ